MTREDAKKILQMFKISYPNSFTNMNIDEAKMFVNLWTEAFLNIPTKVVFDAVKDYIYNTDEKFAPNVGQIRTAIVKNLAPDVEETAIHAWEQFRKFVSDELFVSKQDLIEVQILIEQALADIQIS